VELELGKEVVEVLPLGLVTRAHVAGIRAEPATVKVAGAGEAASVVDADVETVQTVEIEVAEADVVAVVEASKARLVLTGLLMRSRQLLQLGVRRLRTADYKTVRSMTALRSILSGRGLELRGELCIA
jgi:hypothetical protein